MVNKKRALGRGLSALLENSNTDITTRLSSDENATLGSIAEVSISAIEANPFQPRSLFEEEALVELSESIKTYGIIQPVTLRKMGNDHFQLISGERRFRASQIAGLDKIPAYIRVADDQTMLEMALVENIQRENLDAIEIAISYKRLMEECNLTQESLSQKVSKKRSTVTNYLRLLKLPAEIQLGIRKNLISMGHARALVAIEDIDQQLLLFERVVNEELSVRQIEELIRENNTQSKPKPASKNYLTYDLEQRRNYLSERFSNKIDLKRSRSGTGKLVINFKSDDDLNLILSLLESN
jgi:ParB family transcriptional regulator, chromosome partitioning protein